MQRFTELRVWQGSHALVLEIYRLIISFPNEERLGLISQLRRAAASVQRSFDFRPLTFNL
ncbi:MAG TPA: four helix bundle protein [Terriglobia bacterium]